MPSCALRCRLERQAPHTLPDLAASLTSSATAVGAQSASALCPVDRVMRCVLLLCAALSAALTHAHRSVRSGCQSQCDLHTSPLMDCPYCLVDTLQNALQLGRHNRDYPAGSCSNKWRSRAGSSAQAEVAPLQHGGLEDDLAQQFDHTMDWDGPEQDQGPYEPAPAIDLAQDADGGAPTLDCDRELMLLIQKTGMPAADQQTLLDLLHHPAFDVKLV